MDVLKPMPASKSPLLQAKLTKQSSDLSLASEESYYKDLKDKIEDLIIPRDRPLVQVR